MMHRVRLIHWNVDEGEERSQRLHRAGYASEFAPCTPRLIKEMRDDPPDAVVIDLSRLPSQGRDLGVTLRTYKDTRSVPIVLVGGDPAKVDKIGELLPDAVYAEWSGIAAALATAIDETWSGLCFTKRMKQPGR